MIDPPDETPTPPATRHIPVVYFNTAQALATEYELSFDLGYRTATGAEPDFAIRIVTSWEHAKALRDLLDRLIVGYEDSAGPIRDFSDGQQGVTNADDLPAADH